MIDYSRREILKIGSISPLISLLPHFPQQNNDNYEIVYKFTTKRLTSYIEEYAIHNKIKDKYTIKYKIGKEIIPKYGKLFAFNELEAMKEWMRKYAIGYHTDYRKFKCLAKNPIIPTRINTCVRFETMENYWTDDTKFGTNINDFVLCDSIILQEEI